MSVFLCTPEPCRIINYQYTFIHTIAVDLTADEYKLNAELRWNVMGYFFFNSHPLMMKCYFLKLHCSILSFLKKNVVAYFQSCATMQCEALSFSFLVVYCVTFVWTFLWNEALYERLLYCVLLLQYGQTTHIPHSGQQSSSGSWTWNCKKILILIQ